MPTFFENLVNRLLRDHEGYTGDGQGGEGALPQGDPTTAARPIWKRDLRELFRFFEESANSIGDADAAAAAANAAAAAANAAAANLLPYRGDLAGYMARMKAGEAVRIACYGDSTVDGNGTVGWTPNPTNEDGTAIGAAAHNPPNAWPAALRTIIRRMYGNDLIQVWNAGYGGKDIVTGWAINNFETAIINNPAYGTPDICIINFGLNDMVRAVYTRELFKTRLQALLLEMISRGITPVFLTPDPVSEPGARQGGSMSEVAQVYREVAEEQGIAVIDTQRALEMSFSSGGSNSLWAFNQPDDLHFGNVGHRVKAGYIAACMFPNTLWLTTDEPVNIAPWSKHSNTEDLSYSLFDDANNRFGASMNVNSGTYAVGDVLMDVWFWSDSANLSAYWRSVSGDGYYAPAPLSGAPEIEQASYLTAATVAIKSPTAGATQQGGTVRDAEAPAFIGRCTTGLNRLTFRARTDTNTLQTFLGYFSLRPTNNGIPASFAAYWGAGGSGQQVFNTDPFEINAPLVGAGFTRSFNMLADIVMPDGAGVFIYTGRVFGDGTGGVSQRHRGIVLQRSGANARLLDVVYGASGVDTVTQLASGAYAWSETSNEFNIRGGAGNGTQHVLQVTPAGTPLSPILSVVRDRTVAPWPLGGRMGAFFKDYGVSVAGGRTRITVHGV